MSHYDLALSARKALAQEYESEYMIAYENVEFTPPKCGMWLKYDYKEADTIIHDLKRKCISYIGMVQIGIEFPPGSGIDKARKLAKNIADFFEDGKMLSHGYISEGAKVHQVQKSESGWFYPVRFYVRYDG
ncbi:TPA: hypothetical protein H1940_004750 [Salmonella enterica]|nr:hypothetical protein [Salmonella enterica]